MLSFIVQRDNKLDYNFAELSAVSVYHKDTDRDGSVRDIHFRAEKIQSVFKVLLVILFFEYHNAWLRIFTNGSF